jgi:hypothetical protein
MAGLWYREALESEPPWCYIPHNSQRVSNFEQSAARQSVILAQIAKKELLILGNELIVISGNELIAAA